MFRFKDKLPRSLLSGVVYKFPCSGCNATYIGKTIRHLKVRSCEHLGFSHLTGKRVATQQQSAVSEHLLMSSHTADGNNFTVLSSDARNYLLEIKESLFILKEKPVLNRMITSAPLYLFN